MGYEKALMDRLHAVSVAAEAGSDALAKLTKEAETPEHLAPHLTANQQALTAAVALAEAVLLECPGTDKDRAIALTEQIFDLQEVHGFQSLAPGKMEQWTRSHGHLWDTGMAGVLYVSQRCSIGPIYRRAGEWWRQYLDDLALFQVPRGAEHGGIPVLLPPCARGATADNPSLGSNDATDEIFAHINHGRRRNVSPNNRYMAGVRFFYLIRDVALPKPARRIPLAFTVKIWKTGAEFTALAPVLNGLDPQWATGSGAPPDGCVAVHAGWALPAPAGPGKWKSGGPAPSSFTPPASEPTLVLHGLDGGAPAEDDQSDPQAPNSPHPKPRRHQ